MQLPLIQSDLDAVEQLTWVYDVALGGLAAGQASGLDAGLGSMVSDGVTFTAHGFLEPITVAINSQVPAVLSPFVTAENAAAPVLGLLDVSLAVLGAVVVLLGARLVAQRRAAEFTLMRARGAALYQLGWLVLRANVVIAAVAGAAAGGPCPRPDPRRRRRGGLVAGGPHDRRDARRPGADQRGPAAGGGVRRRPAGPLGRRP